MTAIVLLVTCLAAIHVSSEPNQATRTKKQPAKVESPPTTTTVENNNYESRTDSSNPNHKPPEWYASPEWWIVILAALTLLAIAYQSRETANAAKATAIAAEASRDSVKALVNSERAWVMLDSVQPHLDHVVGLISQRNFGCKLRVVFRNFGRTPAWIIGHGFTFSLESKDFRPTEKYAGEIDNTFGGPLPPEPLPENWTPIVIEVELTPERLSVEELQDVVAGEKILVLHGVIIYRDTFSESVTGRLETSLCFKLIFRSADGRAPSRWLYYSPEANRYT